MGTLRSTWRPKSKCRRRHNRIGLLARSRRRSPASRLVVLVAVIVAQVATFQSGVANAEAGRESVIFYAPFDGFWANSLDTGPWEHDAYGADWALDYFGRDVTVRANFGGATGNLDVKLDAVELRSAGTFVRVAVYVDGDRTGTVGYSHLVGVPFTAQDAQNKISVGNHAVLGKTAPSHTSFPRSDVWRVNYPEGVHTHIGVDNGSGYACWIRYVKGTGKAQSHPLGVLGHDSGGLSWAAGPMGSGECRGGALFSQYWTRIRKFPEYTTYYLQQTPLRFLVGYSTEQCLVDASGATHGCVLGDSTEASNGIFGTADLLRLDSAGQATVARSTPTGFGTPEPWDQLDAIAPQPVVADYNRDGLGDLVRYSAAGQRFEVALSTGWTFGDWLPLVTNVAVEPTWWSPGDFNGDASVDVAFFDSAAGRYKVARGSGSAVQRATAEPWSTPGLHAPSTAVSPAVGDFDGDQRSDIGAIVTPGSTYWQLRSNGSSFTPVSGTTGISLPSTPGTARAGDFDADSRSDLLWFDRDTGSAVLLHAQVDGSLTFFRVVPTGYAGTPSESVFSADINDDKESDLILVNSTGVAVFPSASEFAQLSSIPTSGTIVIGDFDGIAPLTPTVSIAADTVETSMVSWRLPDEASQLLDSSPRPTGFHVEVEPGARVFDLPGSVRDLAIPDLPPNSEISVRIWTRTNGGVSAPASASFRTHDDAIGDLVTTLELEAGTSTGEVTSITVTVANNGPDEATGAFVDLLLPDGFVWHAIYGSCSLDLRCDLGPVAPGSTVEVVVIGTPTVANGEFNAEANAETFDNNHDSNATQLATSFAGSDCTSIGSTFPDDLTSGPGDEVICGLTGDDTILASAGNDRYSGGGGERDVASFAAATRGVTVDLALGLASGLAPQQMLSGIEGIVGSNWADTLRGDEGGNRIDGGARADRIYGGPGDDELVGGPGNDTLHPGPGDDYVEGDGAIDVISYESSATGVAVDLTDQEAFGEGHDILSNVSSVAGSPFGDVIEGSLRGDTIRSRGGADRIGAADGVAGNDVIDGGSGADVCVVDPGDDVAGCEQVVVVPLPTQVVVRLTAAEAQRVDALVRFYGTQNEEELLRFGVQVLAFINAIDPQPNPTPVVLPGPGADAAVSLSWAASELPVLDAVRGRWALNAEDAHRWGLMVLDFIAAIQGA